MHEWSIADNLVSLVVEVAAKERLKTVSRVVIRVGVFQQIVPETLETAFSMLAGETVISGARLEMERVPLNAECRSCGASADGREPIFACDNCGSADLEIISGKELYIDYIEGDRENKT
jgi:hydrogenase nickel incorporation protein HypA/HybF